MANFHLKDQPMGRQQLDSAFVTEQVRVCERHLHDLHKQRAELLLELADDPTNENIHSAIAGHDATIAKVQGRIDNLCASMSEAGRRKAEALALKQRREAGTLTEQALDLVDGPRQTAAAQVDTALAALVDAIHQYQALGDQAQKLVHDGVRPVAVGRSWRYGNLSEIACARHGTLTELLAWLESREVRQMRVAEHAQRFAERLRYSILRTLAEADAEASK